MKLSYEKFYYYSFLLFAFTLPLSRASLSLFSVLLPLVWIIEWDFKRKIEVIRQNKILVALFAFYLWSIVSILWSEDKSEAIDKIVKMRYLLIPFIMATSLDRKYIERVLNAFLAGMFISVIVALGIAYNLWSYHQVPSYDPCPFMVHMEYSVFLAFVSALLLERVVSKRYSVKSRIFYALFFLLVTANLFLQAGRTGQVAYLFALFAIVFMHFRFTVKSIVISLLVSMAIFTSGYMMSESFRNVLIDKTYRSVDGMIEKHNYNSSFGVRVAYGITTYNILTKDIKALLFGEGVGDYILATKKELEENLQKYQDLHFRIDFMKKNHPHNQFFAVLLQTGLIGLFLLFLLIYRIVTKRYKEIEIKHMAILFVIVYFMGSMAEPLFFKQFTLSLASLFIGIFSL